MWKTGETKPHLDLSPQPYAKARAMRSLRLLAVILVVMLTMFLVFPLVFEPRVDPPSQVRVNNPLSLSVRISNLNPFAPLTDVEYSCELSRLTLSTGAEAATGRTLTRGQIRKFEGRTVISAPCEATYLGPDPVKAAEYKLTLNYRMYPWPQHRTSQYSIHAQIDGSGHILDWNVE